MKRKKDYPGVSLKTLILWAVKPLTELEGERLQAEIKERQKELQQ